MFSVGVILKDWGLPGKKSRIYRRREMWPNPAGSAFLAAGVLNAELKILT